MWEWRGKLRRSKFIWSTPERVSTEYGGERVERERHACLESDEWRGRLPVLRENIVTFYEENESSFGRWSGEYISGDSDSEGRFRAWGLWEADCLHSDSSLSQGLGLEWEKKVRIPDVPGSKKQTPLYQRGQTQTQGPHRGPGCRNAFSNVLY